MAPAQLTAVTICKQTAKRKRAAAKNFMASRLGNEISWFERRSKLGCVGLLVSVTVSILDGVLWCSCKDFVKKVVYVAALMIGAVMVIAIVVVRAVGSIDF
ncbi:hypothetical protein F5H01DRAFT_354203 [Linnemannia elongata]|nr:hypothetical protein F5H01DRAFT_354203 [Linnemannia elongata]